MSEDSDTDNEFHSPGSNHSTHGPEEEHEEDLSFRENEDLYYGLPHSHPAIPGLEHFGRLHVVYQPRPSLLEACRRPV